MLFFRQILSSLDNFITQIGADPAFASLFRMRSTGYQQSYAQARELGLCLATECASTTGQVFVASVRRMRFDMQMRPHSSKLARTI